MVLIWTVSGVLLVLILLLAVPVELSFSLRLQEGRRMLSGRAIWLFGGVRVPFGGEPDPGKKAKPKLKKPRKEKRKRRPRQGGSTPLATLWVEGFVRRALRLVRRLFTAIHIHHLNVQARLGLQDPADTGRLWSVMGAVGALLPAPKDVRIEIQPDFADEVFVFVSDGRIRVVPLELVLVLLAFALSPKTIRAYRVMRFHS